MKLVLVIIKLFDAEINLPFGLKRNLLLERSNIFFAINFFLFYFLVDIFFVTRRNVFGLMWLLAARLHVKNRNCSVFSILLSYYLPKNFNTAT